MLPTPRALLLDFGGVIVESPRSAKNDNPARLARRVRELIGDVLTEEEIIAGLTRADKQRSRLRDDSTDCYEMSHQQLWADLVAKHWPPAARKAVVARATELTYLWALRPQWQLRPGMADLFDYTIGRGLPVAVVSNTMCGAAHRDALDRLGVTAAFAVQVYSDELGRHKPHPEMIWSAARELDVATANTWFVGDQVHKDIVCARRAGTGAAVLMPEGDREQRDDAAPDAVVTDGHQLLNLLRTAS